MSSNATDRARTFLNRLVISAIEDFRLRRLPSLQFFITLRIAVERALEITEGDHEAGPPVEKSALEDVVLYERPQAVSERARHRHALVGELGRSKRGVAVHLLDQFFEIAEGKLPYRVLQDADRPAGQILISFVHGLERVAHRSFAEQLRLPEVGVPAGPADPSTHHVAPARHEPDIVRGPTADDGEHLVPYRFGATLVRIEAEDPV